LAHLRNRAIRFDEHVLILQAAPKPLDKDIIQETPLAIHADPDAAAFQLLQKPGTGELDTLIGIEYFGPTRTIASCSASTEKSASMVIETRQARTRRLNQSHRDQIHEALGHRDVR
jgi:hypothetical protein